MFKDLMTSSEQTLVGNAGIEVDGIVPIVYTVPYAERETGEYTIEVGYKNYADIAVTESIFVNVYGEWNKWVQKICNLSINSRICYNSAYIKVVSAGTTVTLLSNFTSILLK